MTEVSLKGSSIWAPFRGT